MGHWFNFIKSTFKGEDYNAYLLIMEDRLVIKLATDNEVIRRELRDDFQNILFEESKSQEISLKKFGRVAKNIGVAEIVDNYRNFEEGELSFTRTVENINRAINLLT